MYDYHVVFVNGKPEFKQWFDVVPTFSYNKAMPYFQVCAPWLEDATKPHHLGVCSAASVSA